jgi:SMODS and SLOG-associating 2TM effector domain family 5
MPRFSPNPPPEPGPNYVLENAIHDFKRSVEITRDVRFQANLRLSSRQRLSAYVVSTLSLFVIALSLIPNIIELKPFQSQILLGCSVVLSVFIIFTSLIDSAQNFFHQGELLHQCARKIATIHHELKNIDVASSADEAKETLVELEKRYQLALDECPINHDNIDYYKEIVTKPHLFPDQYNGEWKRLIRARYWLMYNIFGRLWMAPHVVAFIVISLIVYFAILRHAHPLHFNPGSLTNGHNTQR